MGRAVNRVDFKIAVTAANNADEAINQARASLDKYANSTARVRAANERANAAIRRAAEVRKTATTRTKAAAAAEKQAARDINAAAKATERAAAATGKAGNAIGKAGATAKGAFSHGLPGLQGKHDSFTRLASAAGGAGGAMTETTHGIALVDAAMRILPGPAAAATIAIVAIGGAAFTAAKHFSEARAQLKLLGAEGAGDLKSALDITTEGSIKLAQALDDLKDSGLRPSEGLLRDVVKQAKALGKDGAEGAASFVAALAKGPAALRKFQQEFGKLAGAARSLPDIAQGLGLSAERLGLSKAITGEAQKRADVTAGLQRVQLQQLELARTEREIAHQVGTAAEARLFRDKVAADGARAAAENKATAIRTQIESERSLLALIEREAAATTRAAAARSLLAARASVLEAQANLERNKGRAIQIRSNAAVVRQLGAVRARNAFDALHGRYLSDELKTERAKLEVQVLQADAQQLATRAAARSAAQEAGSRARAARAAATEARLRIVTAQVDRDGLRTQGERVRLLDLQQAKELQATGSIRGSKARALARLAIDEDYKTKRAALERELAAATGQTNAAMFTTLEKLNNRRAATAQRTATQLVKAEKARATSIAASLRAAGDVEGAQLVELRQARADYAAALIKIDAELAKSSEAVNATSVEAANLAAEAESKRVIAKLALSKIEGKIDREREGRERAVIGQTATAIGAAAGQIDGKFAAAATSAAASTVKIAASWKGLKKSSPDAISAIGGVAAATVEGERQKHAILAISEAGAALASFAVGDYPAAAAHGASALIYGASATGIIGGASAPAGGAGFADTGGLETPSAQQGQGGGVTVINNFNQPLVTQQQIGRATLGAVRSAGRTGLAKSKGV